jgi:glutamate-1-semialdehyde aminotransferase
MRLAARNAACIMVEVPAWDDEAAVATFLHACRDTADEYGIPFVIDDVVCGFRLALGGSCERYGVKADMVCLGKAMSAIGGVSALIGCADLVGRLADDVFYSTTFGGNPGPCSVAAATIRWLIEHRVGVYGHLRAIGTALKDGLNALDMPVVGQPERSILQFDTDAEWSAFCSAMIEQGVMMHRPQFPTLAHTLNDVRHTLEAAEAIRERA